MLGIPGLSKTFLWTSVGVALALSLDATIAGILNPILTPLKLSYNA